ncbi:MAG: LmeA family phospholipid-binding protein, partial [Halanaerobacter sp.]
MKKIGLILVLIILVSLQFFLPRYTAGQLEESLQEEVDDYQSLQVELNSWPAVELFLNRADQVEIKGDNIVVDRLRLATLRAEFRDLKLAERAGDWEVISGENSSLYLLVKEQDLNDYLKTKDELDIFKRVK